MSQVSSMALSSGISGLTQRTELNAIADALNTTQTGSSRPGSAEAGSMWIDTSGGSTAWLLKVYDGSSGDVVLGTINAVLDTFTPAGQISAFGAGTRNITGSASITNSDYSDLTTVDATSGAVALAIANASLLTTTGWYTILQKTDATANAVTLNAFTAQTINGSSSYVMSSKGEGCLLMKTSSTTFRALPLGNLALAALSQAGVDGVNFAIAAGVITFGSAPVLPSATTATTQSAADNSTHVATTAYADRAGAASSGNAVQAPVAVSSAAWTTYNASGAVAVIESDALPTVAQTHAILSATASLTGKSTSNFLEFEGLINVACGTSGDLLLAAIYEDSSTTPIWSTCILVASNDHMVQEVVKARIAVPDTSAHTYTLRMGSIAGGVWYINGNASSRLFGGTVLTYMKVTEVKG